MAAESNVGARLLLGKDGVLSGLREITTTTANLNRTIESGAKAQGAGTGRETTLRSGTETNA